MPIKEKFYQTYAITWLVIAILLVTLPSLEHRRLRIPDPIGFEYAIQQFANGNWVLSDSELIEGDKWANERGGRLFMYAEFIPNRWVLQKSPGLPLLAIPFQWFGQVRLLNIFFLVSATLLLKKYLSKIESEKFAFLAILLFLFSPISLSAAHYMHMETYISGVLPLIGGVLLLGIPNRPETSERLHIRMLLIGLVIGWAGLIRITDMPLILLFSFGVWHKLRRYQHKKALLWMSFFTGLILPLTVFLIYNFVVFGRFIDSGYRYNEIYQQLYIWSGVAATEFPGVKTWLYDKTIVSFISALISHPIWWSIPLLLGWPLIPLAFLGAWAKFRESPKDRTLWFMIAWGLIAYAPYAGIVYFGITRELFNPFFRTVGYFAVDRFLFPASLPIIYLTTSLLTRLPKLVSSGILTIFFLLSIVWYLYTVTLPV